MFAKLFLDVSISSFPFPHMRYEKFFILDFMLVTCLIPLNSSKIRSCGFSVFASFCFLWYLIFFADALQLVFVFLVHGSSPFDESSSI